MEADESVPLTFEKQQEDGEVPGVLAGLPEGFAPQVRAVEGVPEVIDITGMIDGLEASRRSGGR